MDLSGAGDSLILDVRSDAEFSGERFGPLALLRAPAAPGTSPVPRTCT